MSVEAIELGQSSLFDDLDVEERRRLERWFEERTLRDGHRLTTQGAPGYLFFVILEGAADVEIDGRRMGHLGPGDFFGEAALLGLNGRRTATVVAATDMRVAVIFGTMFRQMEVEFPDVLERLRTAMLERLGSTAPEPSN